MTSLSLSHLDRTRPMPYLYAAPIRVELRNHIAFETIVLSKRGAGDAARETHRQRPGTDPLPALRARCRTRLVRLAVVPGRQPPQVAHANVLKQLMGTLAVLHAGQFCSLVVWCHNPEPCIDSIQESRVQRPLRPSGGV